jgi:nitrogen fixation/metabolism regulation signal transduction histidine kinase
MALTAIGLGWSLNDLTSPFTISGFVVMIILEAVFLFQYINLVKRDFTRFLDAVRNEDPSLLFKARLDDPFFRSLHQDFNDIITNFRLVRKERELERHLFSNIFSQVLVGILVFNAQGKVRLVNNALQKLLEINPLKKIYDVNPIEEVLKTPITTLKHGEERMVNINRNGMQKSIAMLVSRFKLDDDMIVLVTFSDISREIDRKEIETWQRIIKVMRHEILNSISPVRILTSSLINEIEKCKNESEATTFESQTVNKLLLGLSTINKRAAGLAKFVESYRDLTQSIKPIITNLQVNHLIDHVIALFKEQLEKDGVTVVAQIENTTVTILADERMVEQLLINLMKNSLEALKSIANPKITVHVTESNEVVTLKVIDNGVGVPEEIIGDIFTPFFSTKENGTGIGLSLSRQIMQLHEGSIRVNSTEGKGTTFELVFKNGRTA